MPWRTRSFRNVELWIDGKFAGSFDSMEEAKAEVNAA